MLRGSKLSALAPQHEECAKDIIFARDNIPISLQPAAIHLSSAIDTHCVQLTRIVATLFAMIGLDDDTAIKRLSPCIYCAVIRVLRPAESALRRLIVVAAQGLALQPPRAKPSTTPPRTARKHIPRSTFKLFDPRQRFASAFANERRRLHIRLVTRPSHASRH